MKASVLTECQRLIRDAIYSSSDYDGEGVKKWSDERAFVIEPLVMKPAKVERHQVTTVLP